MLIYPGHAFIFFKGGVFFLNYSNSPKFKFIAQENAATLRRSSLHFSHFFLRWFFISHKPAEKARTYCRHMGFTWCFSYILQQKEGDWAKLDPSMLDFQGC